jgi:hypothetical protein
MTELPPNNPLARLTSAALAIGGITGAAFVIVSQGQVAGALAMLSARWMVAHNLHFTSGALLLLGVVGLYLSHSRLMSLAGHFAFVLALLGTAFYFATGVITAALLPVIAGVAPTAVAAQGPLFSPVLPALVVSVAVFHLGWMVLGIVIARAGVLPAWTGWTTAAGAFLGMIPPRPMGHVPFIVSEIAWILLATGLAGMGVAGWRQAGRTYGVSGAVASEA